MAEFTELLDDYAALLADYEAFWHRWPRDYASLVQPDHQRDVEHDALTARAEALLARSGRAVR